MIKFIIHFHNTIEYLQMLIGAELLTKTLFKVTTGFLFLDNLTSVTCSCAF